MAPLNTIAYAERLFRHYATYRVDEFPSQRFGCERLHSILDNIVKTSNGLLSIRMLGKSFEERPIRLVSAGAGHTDVLLWTQMHGDESTATMAVTDILQYLVMTRDEEETKRMLSLLTLHVLPMLNPDGAERHQRRTAQGIDMNRDAMALRTPEANILRQLQRELTPAFGFNLHDQELSTVGTSKELSAIALLAPAFNGEKSDDDVRLRAKHLAATFASVMKSFVPNNLSRYDDSFEPRAFGDNMQKWGTSTLLVESGHAMNDPEKHSIRKLNFVGILASLHGIASGDYKSFATHDYENLPFNGKKAFDLIIRNIQIDCGGERTTPADIAISYQVDTHSESTPQLIDLGDLHTYIGLKEIDGTGKRILQSALKLSAAFEWERFVE